jgi:hypothetical protein
MIKPNLIFSHDWHVQPNCQRSFRELRLSGPFWIEARLLHQVVLELVALADTAFDRFYQRFCANLLNISDFHPRVKLNFSLRRRPFQLTVGGLFLAYEIRSAWPGRIPFKSVAQRKISKSDQQTTLEPIGLTGD